MAFGASIAIACCANKHSPEFGTSLPERDDPAITSLFFEEISLSFFEIRGATDPDRDTSNLSTGSVLLG
jgi:hypothetical protein